MAIVPVPFVLVFLIIFEAILLCSQIILVLARPQDLSRKRFLVLVFAFLQFTIICSLIPSPKIPLNIFIQTSIVYLSSIFLAVMYFRYLIKELELPQLRMYNVRVLTISVGIAFVIAFGITYTITKDIHFSRLIFDIIPILAAFYFSIQTIQFLTQKWRKLQENKSHHGAIIIAGSIGIIFMATMPVVDIFDRSLNLQVLSICLVSVSLLATFYAHMKNHFRQAKLEYQFLNKIGFIDGGEKVIHSTEKLNNFNLTARELDVALEILDGKKYKEIADKMFLHYNTISKHGSNIFRKTNCSNKNEFIALFSTQETEVNLRSNQIFTKIRMADKEKYG